MKESTEEVVELEGVKYSIFQELLEFIYTDKMDDLPLDHEDLVYLLMVANQFQLERLKELCERVLAASLDEDNVLSLWDISGAHEAQQLQRLCLNYMMRHWAAVASKAKEQSIKIPQELQQKRDSLLS